MRERAQFLFNIHWFRSNSCAAWMSARSRERREVNKLTHVGRCFNLIFSKLELFWLQKFDLVLSWNTLLMRKKFVATFEGWEGNFSVRHLMKILFLTFSFSRKCRQRSILHAQTLKLGCHYEDFRMGKSRIVKVCQEASWRIWMFCRLADCYWTNFWVCEQRTNLNLGNCLTFLKVLIFTSNFLIIQIFTSNLSLIWNFV